MTIAPLPMPPPAPEADPLAAAIVRMAGGDPEAMANFYDATCSRVYGLALRILRAADAADEVCVDVFHRVWEQARTFDPKRGSASTWVLTMTRNYAIDRMRSRDASRVRELDLHPEVMHSIDPRPQPDLQALLSDRGEVVRRALALLPTDQREVIELAFFEGMSHGRIAKHLERPLGTIKTRIRAGVRKLAGHLADLDEGRPSVDRQEDER